MAGPGAAKELVLEMWDEILERRKSGYCDYLYKTRKFCVAPVVKGMTRCGVHGGGHPLIGKPLGHHNFKTGAQSKYLEIRMAGQIIKAKQEGRFKDDLPNTLAGRYLTAVNDPTLMDLTSEMAVLDARVAQLLEKVDEAQVTPDMWDKMVGAFEEMDHAMKMHDTPGVKTAMRDMRSIANRVKDDRNNWDEIYRSFEQKRKLQEAERRRREAANLLLTIEQFYDKIAKILAVLFETVEYFESKGWIENGIGQQLYLAVAHRIGRTTGSADREVADFKGNK